LVDKIVIGVASHKPYRMPIEEIYKPIQVGARGKESIRNYQRDDSDNNISEKNPYFSELTALYWIWKNVHNAEYKGLVHYRRYFSSKKQSLMSKGNFDDILDEHRLRELLSETNVIVPEKRHYYIETMYSHYQHSHNIRDLELLRDEIHQQSPEFDSAFSQMAGSRSAHMFNMMVMKSDLFDSYCQWMFDILFALEDKIDLTNYNRQESRVFGYLSELMMDVWLDGNGIKYKEVPVMFMENQNWVKKGTNFLIRKVLGKSKTSAHMGD
jgi:hypothetical protein